MSIDGARDMNVFFSSPRVGYGEPPTPSTASSLLTFADMVLALDRQNINEHAEFQSSSVDITAENDHTYAFSGSSRTTRSQTAKAAALLTGRFLEEEKSKTIDKDNNEAYCSNSVSRSTILSSNCMTEGSDIALQLKDKRSSSFENVFNESQVTARRTCEWPDLVPKSSPRKACSFEEVSDCSKSCLKSSKSSENVHRSGVSETLHKFVNNTLEFPCWPRKADHTYATATWDGTAASHSLFDHEIRAESPRINIAEDQEMEGTDHDYALQNQCDQMPVVLGHQLQNFALLMQKDDHTYVKSKCSQFCPSTNVETETPDLTKMDIFRKQTFSSATFPRQKMRDDHTYFHSGLPRRSSAGSGSKEWVSSHSVAMPTTQQELQVEEAYRNLNSVSQSASAKKDHNYSTSA